LKTKPTKYIAYLRVSTARQVESGVVPLMVV
jgi:hypothetical protein